MRGGSQPRGAGAGASGSGGAASPPGGGGGGGGGRGKPRGRSCGCGARGPERAPSPERGERGAGRLLWAGGAREETAGWGGAQEDPSSCGAGSRGSGRPSAESEGRGDLWAWQILADWVGGSWSGTRSSQCQSRRVLRREGRVPAGWRAAPAAGGGPGLGERATSLEKGPEEGGVALSRETEGRWSLDLILEDRDRRGPHACMRGGREEGREGSRLGGRVPKERGLQDGELAAR